MYKVTRRIPNQMQLDFSAPKVQYPNFDCEIKQQSEANTPFIISVKRRYNKTTVTIRHSALRSGYLEFTRLYFETPLAIVAFCRSIISNFNKIYPTLFITGEDIAFIYTQIRKEFYKYD